MSIPAKTANKFSTVRMWISPIPNSVERVVETTENIPALIKSNLE